MCISTARATGNKFSVLKKKQSYIKIILLLKFFFPHFLKDITSDSIELKGKSNYLF